MNDIDAIRALIEYFATDVARVCAAHIPDENCFHHADCLRVQNARAAIARIERLVEAGDAMADEIDAAGRRDDKGVLALIPTYTAFRAARKGGA